MNIFEFIDENGSDEGFTTSPPPRPTDALPGTQKKFAVLRARVRLGMDLFYKNDPDDWEGKSSAEQPMMGTGARNGGRKNSSYVY